MHSHGFGDLSDGVQPLAVRPGGGVHAPDGGGLGGAQLGLAAPGAAAGPGGLQALAGALDDQLALELVDRAEDVEGQAYPQAQRDALRAAGCEQVFTDTASGKLASRPELDKALLSASRAGDQLVVAKLDRLGRSLEHLIQLSAELDERDGDGRRRYTVAQIAAEFGVTRPTIYRHVDRAAAAAR